MNIVILTGSPQKHGSSDLLAEQFVKGAKEAGNSVSVIDAAWAAAAAAHARKKTIWVRKTAQCAGSKPKFPARDGMSAQLKTVIGRFCAFNGDIPRKQMKPVRLAVARNAARVCGGGEIWH